MEEQKGLSGTVSLSMKLNLGNYESADVFLSVSNITTETNQSEVEALLNSGMKISYDALKVQMAEKIRVIRAK